MTTIKLNNYEDIKQILLQAYNSKAKIKNTLVINCDFDALIKPRVWSPNDNVFDSSIINCFTYIPAFILDNDNKRYFIEEESNDLENRLLNDKELSNEFKAWVILNNFEFLRRNK